MSLPSLPTLVRLEGLEPPTTWFEARHSDPTELQAHGASGGTRTLGPRLRKLPLCPLSHGCLGLPERFELSTRGVETHCSVH